MNLKDTAEVVQVRFLINPQSIYVQLIC